MKTRESFWLGALITTVAAIGALAQDTAPPAAAAAPPAAPVQRSPADLEKLVGPIALYPDPLLATLLPASAYPLEIVQAARFIKDTNNIPKVDSQPWDQNVKALAQFPDVLGKMNEDIAWTSDLGQAFVDDQKAVMDAIQSMRGKAQQAGNLKTTPQQVVVVTNTVIEKTVEQQVVYVTNTVVQIQPAQSEVVYVPTYNPAVVYAPPPPGQTAAASVISFGVGMAVGAIIANNCDWHSGGVYWGGGYHGDVDIDIDRNVNINQNVNVNRNVNQNANVNRSASGQKWQPDASRRTSSAPAATAQARGYTPSAAGASAPRTTSVGAGQPAATAAARPAAASAPAASRAAGPGTSGAGGGVGSAGGSGGGGGLAAGAGAGGGGVSSGGARSGAGVSSGGGGHSAFGSPGGGAQTRQASARGGGSRGGGGRR